MKEVWAVRLKLFFLQQDSALWFALLGIVYSHYGQSVLLYLHVMDKILFCLQVGLILFSTF